MMSNKLYSIIAKIMGISESDITDESGPETIANWTSFNSYVLLYQLESEFNVKLIAKSIVSLKFALKRLSFKIEYFATSAPFKNKLSFIFLSSSKNIP